MDMEEFIDAVVAHLKQDLPGRIVTLNAEKAADGREIEVLIPDDDAYSTGADPILKHPWVEVAAPDFLADEFDLSQRSGRFGVNVVVRGWIAEVRPPVERADRHVKRFGKCLMQSLTQPGAFGPGEVIQSVRGAYRVNPELDEKGGPMAAVTFVFTLDSEYVRP